MKRVLCVWFPNWPVQRLRGERPELEGRPLILHADKAGRGSFVVACSAEAAHAGVVPGMPLAEALAVGGETRVKSQETRAKVQCPVSSETRDKSPETRDKSLNSKVSQRSTLNAQRGSSVQCPVSGERDSAHRHTQHSTLNTQHSTTINPLSTLNSQLSTHPHSPAGDRAALEQLGLVCHRYTPRVAVEQVEEPEALLLDIAGCQHLFGGEEELVAAVKAELQSRGYRVRLAVADTIGAAWALARYGELSQETRVKRQEIREAAFLHNPPQRSTLNAQRKSSVQCPVSSVVAKTKHPQHWTLNTQHSTTIHPLSTLNSQLSTLPAAALRLPGDTLRKLRRLGLETIGQVLKLPRSTLPSRFGKLLLERIDQLTGARPEPVPLLPPPDPIEAVWEFDDPVDDRRTLEEVLRRLLHQLADELAARRQATMKVRCLFESSVECPVSSETRVQSQETRAKDTAAVDLQRSTLNARRESSEARDKSPETRDKSLNSKASQRSTLNAPRESSAECPVSSETRVQSPESRAKDTAAVDLPRSTLDAQRRRHTQHWTLNTQHSTTINPLSTLNSQLATLHLSRPTASASHLQELVSLKLERAALPAGVTRVRVEADPLPIPAARQRSLFDDEAGVRAQIQLAALLDRLRSRLGDRTVLSPRLADDWLPERSVKWEESQESPVSSVQCPVWLQHRHTGHSTLDTQHSIALSQLSTLNSQLPVRLYRVPQPADVVLLHDRPLRLGWERREELVAHSVGPHRIETGWWRARFVQRDYYRLVTHSGRRLWVFARPRRGGWFIAGE